MKIRRNAKLSLVVVTGFLLSSAGVLATSTPAFAAACVPAATTSWTGDGTFGSVVGKTYTVLTFSTAGTCTWTPPGPVTDVHALVVSGGGGGAGGSGTYDAANFSSGTGAPGSGGGGGKVIAGGTTIPAGTDLTIVVGAGGALGAGGSPGGPGVCGANGGDSSISELSLVATGGKGGIGGGQNATCTAENRDGSNHFIATAGGDSGSGFTGGSAGTHQSGSGASSTANGGTSGSVVTGETLSYSGVSGNYADGGGGAGATTYGSRSASNPGSGGGGGREPLYQNPYRYGYAGSDGVSGLVVLRYYEPVVDVTASTPAAVTLGQDVPSVTYTTDPATSPGDWTTAPVCGVYAAGNLTTPLTNITEAGSYVTHCTGGVLANGTTVVPVDGTFTVNPLVVKADSPPPVDLGQSVPEITFSTEPADAVVEWSEEPTCGVYASGNLNTPVTQISEAGTYVTHCSGGTLSNGATAFVFEDGEFVVKATLPNTGLMWASALGVVVVAGLLFLLAGGTFGTRGRLRLAGIDIKVREKLDQINAALARMDRSSRRRKRR
jgi:hypothetical protein